MIFLVMLKFHLAPNFKSFFKRRCIYPSKLNLAIFLFSGYVLKLEWFCSTKHRDYWYSSQIYGSGFAINYVLDTALIGSGGQINQFQRFSKFVNLGKVSPTSFYRNQRFYAIPTIEQEFEEMRDTIIQELQTRSEPVVLCGDCQLDSPGWSVTKVAYTFTEYNSKKLVSMKFGDKREV